ncbi:MAG: hypothetical protein HOF57_03910 [Euryarchaeota archaeon]|jgi:uncharacterized coiled-coil DUF342 family protein|nr:hypothetical protein [Euryarchaeota archaeon]MBT3847001.1 hypothetical protein [Euryarchaeota archaeon]MBT4156205.1 hypothetical protein [Euryarchaeota archaeon]MBT4475728.1 hypothetical protein [Euryarchaeota archaeon]MBT4794574.1 hypothetical protein [Euryarchaeota archaeon]
MMDFDEVRTILSPKSESIDEKLSIFREDRDTWNSKVKKYLTERNEINRQVKELITEVQNQKVIRDEANSKVKELKIIRAERSTVLKQLRAELQEKKPAIEPKKQEKREKKRNERTIRSDIDKMDMKFNYGHFQGKEKNFEREMKKLYQELKNIKANKVENAFSELESNIRSAAKSQEEAHKLVEEAVTTAQESHDLMIELSEEVDRLRAKANSSQEGVIRSKREADLLHNKYVVSLRSIHSIQDLFKAMVAQEKNLDDDTGSKLEVTDLMSRLMSGDTLSTDELMALQRN